MSLGMAAIVLDDALWFRMSKANDGLVQPFLHHSTLGTFSTQTMGVQKHSKTGMKHVFVQIADFGVDGL